MKRTPAYLPSIVSSADGGLWSGTVWITLTSAPTVKPGPPDRVTLGFGGAGVGVGGASGVGYG